MTAEEEENKLVSLAKVKMEDDGTIKEDRIQCRLEADFPVVSKEQVESVDVAPNQMASVAASLIPFLEHDDAHRALMGANMMRQAVPFSVLNPLSWEQAWKKGFALTPGHISSQSVKAK